MLHCTWELSCGNNTPASACPVLAANTLTHASASAFLSSSTTTSQLQGFSCGLPTTTLGCNSNSLIKEYFQLISQGIWVSFQLLPPLRSIHYSPIYIRCITEAFWALCGASGSHFLHSLHEPDQQCLRVSGFHNQKGHTAA